MRSFSLAKGSSSAMSTLIFFIHPSSHIVHRYYLPGFLSLIWNSARYGNLHDRARTFIAPHKKLEFFSIYLLQTFSGIFQPHSLPGIQPLVSARESRTIIDHLQSKPIPIAKRFNRDHPPVHFLADSVFDRIFHDRLQDQKWHGALERFGCDVVMHRQTVREAHLFNAQV